MRYVAIVMLLLISPVLVSAVGVLVPPGADDAKMNATSPKTLEFTLVGGEGSDAVVFSASGDGLLVNGKTKYQKNVSLVNYSREKIVLNLTLSKEKSVLTWGYVVGSGGGQFEQVVSRTVNITRVVNATNVTVNLSNASVPKVVKYAVSFTSKPSGAKLYVNGTSYGHTPLTVNLSNGTYRVKAVAQSGNYYDASETLVVHGSETLRLELVAYTPSTSSGGGGGGGGSGGVSNYSVRTVVKNVTASNYTVVPAVVGPPSPVVPRTDPKTDAVVQDVAGGEGGIAVGVGDVSQHPFYKEPVVSSVVGVSGGEEKMVLGIVVALGFFALLSQVASIVVLRSVGA